MPKLFHLHIENFRCIKKFDYTFKDGLTCIIGRGDSGKTTILDAISYALTPLNTLIFHDGDFFNCNVDNAIIIEVTLIELTDEILRRFGNQMRGIKNGKIIKSMLDPEAQDAEPAVTLQLKVEKDLEPQWHALGVEGDESRFVRASERDLFNCFYISEYNDRHFTLSRGTPLSTLFKQKAEKKVEVLNAELIADLGRNAKTSFETSIQSKDVFADVINSISENSNNLGLRMGDLMASLDQREFLLRENKIALHQNNIPLRQLGKGSKRLLSLAIQLSLTDPSGIILIDEIEQGLEPDRVQQIVSYLSGKKDVQIIVTTHSSPVIQTLSCSQLVLKRAQNSSLQGFDNRFQGLVRSHPAALLTRSIIVAEGKTELGFLRGFELTRQTQCQIKSFSYYGVCTVDGNGDECFKTASGLAELGYRVCLFCDADKQERCAEKDNIREKGVDVFDCEEGNCFEMQLFKDCNWESIKKIIEYRIGCGLDNRSVFENVKTQMIFKPDYQENWYAEDNVDLRIALGRSSSKSKWFKHYQNGQELGSIIFENEGSFIEGSRLSMNSSRLIAWIQNQ